jgi:hypothetical protein
LDVTSTGEQALIRCTDEEQLEWATREGRAIYSYNASDFCRLHSTRLQQDRHHAGIIIGDQQTISIGEEMGRLLKLTEAKNGLEMMDRLEFLNNWR